jgi:hypothetical protein
MLAILILTLPTQPNAVRVRVWRALKTLGCGALRDGAYLLPSEHAVLFEPLAAEVREHGGSAMVLSLSPRDDAQRDELLALFDRTEAYAAWRDTVTALQSDLPALGETEARRRGRAVAEALHALRRIDYYPGAAADHAQAAMDTLRLALDARFSRGEPQAQLDHGIERLDARKFQGKRWATRARASPRPSASGSSSASSASAGRPGRSRSCTPSWSSAAAGSARSASCTR